jgi:NACHT domain
MNASTRLECHPKTRVDIRKLIQDWATDPTSSQKVFWLHGLAGSGKSTLATTVANRLRESGQLGAFLFFDRDVMERSDPTNIIRTLAYELGLSSPQIGAKITAVIEDTPNISMSPLRLQFMKLIIEPLSAIEGSLTTAPLILILDALDECGTAAQRKSLLAMLAAESHNLPSILRILITSCSEFDICRAFESRVHVLAHELDITSEVNAEDISEYLRDCMIDICNENIYLDLGEGWPGEHTIQRLVRRARGLFMWASTASKFIDKHDPKKSLEILLKEDKNSGAESALDALYRTALESSGKWDDSDFVDDFCSILGIILVARNPLSHSDIDGLLGPDNPQPSKHTISLLACVLGQSPTVRVLHPSFADFLMDRERCGRDMWHIDRDTHNLHLAVICLKRLDRTLKENICDLTLDPSNVHGELPQDLAYACLFWIEHICMVTDDEVLIMKHLDDFLHQHLLHWIEAMSILKRSRETITLLDSLYGWVKVCYFTSQQLFIKFHNIESLSSSI